LPPDYQPERGPTKEIPPQFRRAVVDYPTVEPSGTIIIDTPNTYLYLTLGKGKAIRYGVGVGREGFTWSGTERIRCNAPVCRVESSARSKGSSRYASS